MKHDSENPDNIPQWSVCVEGEKVFTGSYEDAVWRAQAEEDRHPDDAEVILETAEAKTATETPVVATRDKMERLALQHPNLIMYSPVTGETCSANPGDYFWRDPHTPFTDEDGEKMLLGVQTSEITPVTEEPTASVDVPFEPQFGEMSHAQLLTIARRYHQMLAEVEAFAPDSECEEAGDLLVIDEVERDESDQTYIALYGARQRQADMTKQTPYILGEVQ